MHRSIRGPQDSYGYSTGLFSDASGIGVGAVLTLKENDSYRPIAYASRRFSDAETRYHSSDLECLAALVWAVSKFRPYLYGKHLTVLTDCAGLRTLSTESDLHDRWQRWVLTLQDYDYDIQHLPGGNNSQADALSRAYPSARKGGGGEAQPSTRI